MSPIACLLPVSELFMPRDTIKGATGSRPQASRAPPPHVCKRSAMSYVPGRAAAGIALSGWREAAIAYRVTTPFFKKFTQDAPLFFIGGGLFFIVEFVSIEIE